MNNINEFFKKIESTYKEKNLLYGNTDQKICSVLNEIFPNKIDISNYENFIVITKILEKLFRLTNENIDLKSKKDAWKDLVGYALLGIMKDEDLNQNSNDDKKSDLVELNFLVKTENDSTNDLMPKIKHFENRVVTINHKQKCGLGNEYMMVTSRGILRLDKNLCSNPAIHLLNFENEIHETVLISNILDIKEGL